MTTDARVVLSTVPNEQVAEQIARTLLAEHLVACVNIVPGVRSLYRWQGRIEDDRELLLIIKTTAAHYPQLEARLRELHPYEVCEVLCLEVDQGSPAYLQWMALALAAPV